MWPIYVFKTPNKRSYHSRRETKSWGVILEYPATSIILLSHYLLILYNESLRECDQNVQGEPNGAGYGLKLPANNTLYSDVEIPWLKSKVDFLGYSVRFSQ